ncbi:hypothetical protein BUALT_Bualt08G0033500 [Buddleja alternifolia]|uniref:BHLH domain-containing protein n=1 Tax=Buddleja alternifolia TaxID=168488 RepID=A0AAV6X3C0_9LAMI|nr:hypothetical protein BUALT_Bualt08G0033500 [Buddleja alternifolia]
MGSEKNGGGVFHGNSVMNCTSSNGMDPFYAAASSSSNWDPIVSLNQSGDFGNSCNMVDHNEFGNHTMGSSSNLDHFPSHSVLVEMVPKIPSFGNGSFSETVTSFAHIPQSNFAQNSEDGMLGSSPYGKRKRKTLNGACPKIAEEEQKDPSGHTSKQDDEKKQKFEQNTGTNSRNKQAVKQAKDDPIGSKENYIHVRAKRGQATNSHSLAERVRRERISERMKLLQELVPGCNKITGKAVMLDEIINYVQSLQQQVEFLSMKLTTVNPELNVDIDRILSKDILHLRGSNGTSFGIGQGMNSSQPFPGYPHGTFNVAPAATPPFHSLPQRVDIMYALCCSIYGTASSKVFLQMGFDSGASVSSLGPNGLSKMEL